MATTPISARNVDLAITSPVNQSEVTAFVTAYTTTAPSLSSSSHFWTNDIYTHADDNPQRTIEVEDGYQIYTQLCTPSTFENGTDVVEFAVHGYVRSLFDGFEKKKKLFTCFHFILFF